jgi:hypothetical protein
VQCYNIAITRSGRYHGDIQLTGFSFPRIKINDIPVKPFKSF